MGEHEHGNVFAQGRFHLAVVDQQQTVATLAAKRLRDVQVRREVASLADDHAACRGSLGRNVKDALKKRPFFELAEG
jgi:phage I-like protein